MISGMIGLPSREKSDFMMNFLEWKAMKNEKCLLINFGLPHFPSLPFPQMRRVI